MAEAFKNANKIKYDWYQTDSDVTVNILIKDLKEENVKVNIEQEKFSFEHHSPDDEIKRDLTINLFKQIQPEKSSFKLTKTKCESKLKKNEFFHWPTLNAVANSSANSVKIASVAAPATAATTTNSSIDKRKNWDKMIKEFENEEKLNNDSVDQLFSQIYASGNDDVKRAMVKSFTESCGTCLSTNWSEIKEKKTEANPPDGLEFKKWN